MTQRMVHSARHSGAALVLRAPALGFVQAIQATPGEAASPLCATKEFAALAVSDAVFGGDLALGVERVTAVLHHRPADGARQPPEVPGKLQDCFGETISSLFE